MTEPLTDEQFETLKALSLHPRVSFDNFRDAQRLVDRLMATVEHWKHESLMWQAQADQYLDVLHDTEAKVDSLKVERVESSVWLKYHLLQEQNAKLKEEVRNWKDAVHDYSVALKEKEKENVKLKKEFEGVKNKRFSLGGPMI